MSPLDQPSNASSSKRTLDPPASSRSRRSEEARARARREISRHRAATRARQDSSAPAGGVHPYGLLGYVTEGTLQHQYSFPIGTLQQQPPYLPVTDGSFAREGPAFMGLESEDLNGALLPAISHNGRFHSPWTVPERGLDDTSMPPQEVLPATIDPALLHSSSAPALLPILSAIPTDTPPIPSIQLPELPNVFHSGSAHMQAHLQPSHPSVRLPSQDAAELPAAEVEEPQAAGPSARSVLHNVDRHNQPIAGPSSEHARRVQPKRASKRKQEDHENRPVVITADGRSKRQRLTKQTNAPAPAPAPAPAATAAAKEPVRTRRKNCELEVVEVTPGTRCQLDGCTAALPENVAKARQHMLTHFRKVAVPANDTPKKQGARKGKKKASSRTAAPTSAEPQTMKMVDKYPCPFTTAEGGRCGDHPRSQYADRLGLQRHIEGEHYKWEVRCPICRETFRRRDALTRHRKTVDCQPPPPPAALPETGSTLEPGADSNSDASSESATDSESDSDSD